ncbi:unnamed protein product [Trichobilharzia regenti]|nr:unnamed protein product [Trichobilharzia regenti]
MQRLDDSELSKPPSEVLEIICKLGKGSYGSVYKARYKANGGIVAVKKVSFANPEYYCLVSCPR